MQARGHRDDGGDARRRRENDEAGEQNRGGGGQQAAALGTEHERQRRGRGEFQTGQGEAQLPAVVRFEGAGGAGAEVLLDGPSFGILEFTIEERVDAGEGVAAVHVLS